MTLVLPYPNTPLNGQPGDPVPIDANFTAITQAIQDFDGSQIAAGSVTDGALATNIDPITRGKETIANFVYSGCTWSSVSGLAGTMAGGTYYVNGNRIVSPGVVSHTFTASKDTYIDLDYLGNVTYVAVANGATSGMTLTANAIRVALVVTGSSSISSVTQTGIDPISNQIYPNSPALPLNWINWTPSFTNWTIGTGGSAGTIARYIQIGKTVDFYIISTLGTSGQSVGSNVSFSLPVTASTGIASTTFTPIGSLMANCASVLYSGQVWAVSNTTSLLVFQTASGAFTTTTGTSSTIPGTWAASNLFTASGTYEAA